jgi:hypothetical protein
MSRTPTQPEDSDFDLSSAQSPDVSEQSPAPATEDAQPSAVKPEAELPNDLAKSLELLRKAHNMPERTAREEQAKNATVKRVGAHVLALQQGLPVIYTDPGFLAKQHMESRGERMALHMESLAKNDPIVREFLDSLKPKPAKKPTK